MYSLNQTVDLSTDNGESCSENIIEITGLEAEA